MQKVTLTQNLRNTLLQATISSSLFSSLDSVPACSACPMRTWEQKKDPHLCLCHSLLLVVSVVSDQVTFYPRRCFLLLRGEFSLTQEAFVLHGYSIERRLEGIVFEIVKFTDNIYQSFQKISLKYSITSVMEAKVIYGERKVHKAITV